MPTVPLTYPCAVLHDPTLSRTAVRRQNAPPDTPLVNNPSPGCGGVQVADSLTMRADILPVFRRNVESFDMDHGLTRVGRKTSSTDRPTASGEAIGRLADCEKDSRHSRRAKGVVRCRPARHGVGPPTLRPAFATSARAHDALFPPYLQQLVSTQLPLPTGHLSCTTLRPGGVRWEERFETTRPSWRPSAVR
jgi:hypothetical protein